MGYLKPSPDRISTKRGTHTFASNAHLLHCMRIFFCSLHNIEMQVVRHMHQRKRARFRYPVSRSFISTPFPRGAEIHFCKDVCEFDIYVFIARFMSALHEKIFIAVLSAIETRTSPVRLGGATPRFGIDYSIGGCFNGCFLCDLFSSLSGTFQIVVFVFCLMIRIVFVGDFRFSVLRIDVCGIPLACSWPYLISARNICNFRAIVQL